MTPSIRKRSVSRHCKMPMSLPHYSCSGKVGNRTGARRAFGRKSRLPRNSYPPIRIRYKSDYDATQRFYADDTLGNAPIRRLYQLSADHRCRTCTRRHIRRRPSGCNRQQSAVFTHGRSRGPTVAFGRCHHRIKAAWKSSRSKITLLDNSSIRVNAQTYGFTIPARESQSSRNGTPHRPKLSKRYNLRGSSSSGRMVGCFGRRSRHLTRSHSRPTAANIEHIAQVDSFNTGVIIALTRTITQITHPRSALPPLKCARIGSRPTGATWHGRDSAQTVGPALCIVPRNAPGRTRRPQNRQRTRCRLPHYSQTI